jgi:hypothetical protein
MEIAFGKPKGKSVELVVLKDLLFDGWSSPIRHPILRLLSGGLT